MLPATPPTPSLPPPTVGSVLSPEPLPPAVPTVAHCGGVVSGSASVEIVQLHVGGVAGGHVGGVAGGHVGGVAGGHVGGVAGRHVGGVAGGHVGGVAGGHVGGVAGGHVLPIMTRTLSQS